MKRFAASWCLVLGGVSAQVPDAAAWGVEECVAQLADAGSRKAAVERLAEHGAAALPSLVALLAEMPIRREAVDGHRAALEVVGRLSHPCSSRRGPHHNPACRSGRSTGDRPPRATSRFAPPRAERS